MTEDGVHQTLPMMNRPVLVSQKSLSNYLVEIPSQNLYLDLNVVVSSFELSLPFNNKTKVATGLCGNYIDSQSFFFLL